jgi:hypothetical protein
MKRLLIALTAGLFAVIPVPAHAQIGWTLQQCRSHYGKEFATDIAYMHLGETNRFQSKVYGIMCDIYVERAYDLFNEKVWNVQYLNISNGKPFPIEVVKKLLRDNFPALTWTQQPTNKDAGDEDEFPWSSGTPGITAVEESNGRGTWILTIGWETCPE